MTHGKVARLIDPRIKEGLDTWGVSACRSGYISVTVSVFPPLEGNERSRELNSFPDWHYYSQGFDEKGFWNLQEDFNRLVEDLKGTKFNAVHIANYAWHKLDEYAGILETYPNLYSDMSGRMAELAAENPPRTTSVAPKRRVSFQALSG
jgi:hypothetical protein